MIMKSGLEESDIIWAVTTIINDLGGNPNRRGVVLLAFGSFVHIDPSEPTGFIPQPWRRLRDLMNQAITMHNAIFVLPSGNSRSGATHETTDQMPAIFASLRMGFLPLTIVGACDNDGILASFSQQYPYIKVWAPGVDAACARDGGVTNDDGTSISAGMVAGLAAYFLSPETPMFTIGGGNTASNFNNFLKNTASWQRARAAVGGVPRVLYVCEYLEFSSLRVIFQEHLYLQVLSQDSKLPC